MFTGIVTEVGRIARIEPLDAGRVRLAVTASDVLEDAAVGDSVAVNGVCLTVAELYPTGFAADVMDETLNRTTLGGLAPGAPVNLELPATPTTVLGGHIVQGHVDGVGTIVSRSPEAGFDAIVVELPARLARFVAEKGSITIDGVSLTVTGVDDADGHRFGVSLIPTTLRQTTLGELEEGSGVNLEVDVIAKYVERLVSGPGVTR